MSKSAKDRAAAKRLVVEQQARERRRRVTLWTSVAVVAVLLIAGAIGWGVLAQQDRETAGRLTVPAAAVDDGTAFAAGTGTVTVDVYEDFMCPICGVFEQQSGAALKQLISENKVTVRYHPIAILDEYSNGKRFSTRAVGAVAAAAEAGKFAAYHEALFANQPEEGSDGLSDAKLVELGKAAGLDNATFADAVTAGTYTAWAADVTEKASARGITGTPTVLVAGKKIQEPNGGPPGPATLTAAVAAAAG